MTNDTTLNLSWECITTESKFNDLKDIWNELLSRSHDDSLFSRHEWVEAAWQWKKNDSHLRIVCIYNNNQLIGICPLIINRRKISIFSISIIEFLSVPDNQFSDIICEKNHHQDVISSMADYLYETRKKWDRLELGKLPSESPTNDSLIGALNKVKLKAYMESDGNNPYIDLSDSWESYYSRRSRRLKKGNNLVVNHLKRDYKEIKILHQHQNIDDTLQAVIDISSKSWKKNTGLTLDQKGPNGFIKTITKYAYENGWLSIWLLLLDNNPVAMEYQLIYNDKVYALRADFDTGYNNSSPGTYLNWEILKELFLSSNKFYFMGPGENKYKLRWAESSEKLNKIYCFSDNIYGKFLAIVFLSVLPGLKKLYRRLNVKNSKTNGNKR